MSALDEHWMGSSHDFAAAAAAAHRTAPVGLVSSPFLLSCFKLSNNV